MQKENQDIVVAILIGSLFILLFGSVAFMVMINYFRRKRKLLLEKEKQEAHFKQTLLEAQLEMQEHTFRIISQEIHDNVGQILSLAKINLNIITIEQKENESFHTIKDLVTNAIGELRDLGTGYYADRLVEEGLIQAIRHQLQQLNKTGLFTTSFESEFESLAVEKNKIIFVYRMVQEVLNNVVKHSGADKVSIHIFKEDDEVHIKVSDNGKGFVKSSAGFKPGIGLSSIQQRALMIGATADISSIPGTGTTVNLIFKQII
ncbi:MAG: ATP-binding protein [Bacteroidota bacterium]